MPVEREDGTPVGNIWAVLTRGEALELMEALVFYFGGDDALTIANLLREVSQPENDPGWHCDLGQTDELTIAVEVPES